MSPQERANAGAGVKSLDAGVILRHALESRFLIRRRCRRAALYRTMELSVVRVFEGTAEKDLSILRIVVL